MAAPNKNNPFKTPEGYFDNFTDGLLDKLGEEKLNIPKEDGFAIPEDYFEGLQTKIQEKLGAQETKVVQLHPYRKYYFAAASVAAVLLFLFGLNWNAPKNYDFADLAEADIESYFDTNAYGLSSYEIAEMLPDEDLELNDILENQFVEENVIEYLSDHIDDFEELNIEDYE